MDRRSARARPTAPMLFEAAVAALASDRLCAAPASARRGHAVEVACMARELATLAGVDPGDAFSAGLLHDIGELLLMGQDPSGYSALLREVGRDHREQLRREKLAYGTDHALLGAEHLLEHRFPHTVADAVADHHDPFHDSDPTTIVVAAADELLEGDADRRHAVALLDVSGIAHGAASHPHASQ